MQKKTSANTGQNKEYPIPAKEEALNSRNLGGETIPKYPAEKSIVMGKETGRGGVPLSATRQGERRI